MLRPERLTNLPAGTVTFLFSDIEGSTGLLKRLGERYAKLIADHRRIIRDTFGEHGGTEIDGQGDSFFFAFASAREAVAAPRQHSARMRLTNGPAERMFASEWDYIQANQLWGRRVTSVSTWFAPRASAPPGAAGTCCSRRRPVPFSDRAFRRASPSFHWVRGD